jgi:hypothetical protein
MGHEFRGGTFRQQERASAAPAALSVRELNGGLAVSSSVELARRRYRRVYWIPADAPAVHVWLEGSAPDRCTVTLWFGPVVHTRRLVMDTPGGVVARPPTRWYAPTFWPVQSELFLQDAPQDPGLALWQRRPGAVSYAPDTGLEAVAVRNATRERAFGLLPIPANPATAHDRGTHSYHCALLFTPTGEGCPSDVHAALGSAAPPWQSTSTPTLGQVASALLTVTHPAVRVLAVKPASRGKGIIVRLYAPHPPSEPFQVALTGQALRSAWRCDGRERNLAPLPVDGDRVHLSMDGTIATVRMLVQ